MTLPMTWTEAVLQRLTVSSRPDEREAEAAVGTEQAAAWWADIPSAVVVFLIAVPLCLGIAVASGAPLFSGVISGIVGGIVVGSLSGSQLMVSGPAAGLTAVVLSAIATVGSYPAFLTALVLAGGVQLVLAALRAGIVAYYFPSCVIRGMLAAIGLILILKQIPHAVGYDADYVGDETFIQITGENTFTAIANAFSRFEPGAVILSVLAFAMLIAWNRTRLKTVRLLPAPLAVVLAGVVAQWFLPLINPAWRLGPEHLVGLPVPSSLAEAAALFAFPDWSALLRIDIWRIAVLLGIVASLESLLSLEATGRMDRYRRDASTNRELAAQGVGNVVAGLIGGLPVTGVIVRSAANVDAGARTRRSTIMHGVLLLVAVFTIPSLLNGIPLASLAAILIYTGFRLMHPRLLQHEWRQGAAQWLPFVVTLLAILLSDLLVGIAIGLSVGFAFVLVDQLRSLGFTVVSPKGSVLTRLKLHEHVSFLQKASLARTLEALPPGSRIEIDGTACRSIDHDVLEYISDFRETARVRHIDFRIVGISLPPISFSH
jgi:MFS superfamily sulfate permease-like transporter